MAEVDAGPAPQPLPSTPAGAAPVDLEERERDVLSELAREVDAWVSFQGLRRQLGVHQQALARVLRRMEQQGLVAHEGRGYQLTAVGLASLRGEATRERSRPVLPVLTAILPPHVQPRDVAAQLSRRWFGGLRWYGQSEAPGETSLHWLADRIKVTVRVSAGNVTLEVEDTPGSHEKAFAAARPVLAALSELYGSSAS